MRRVAPFAARAAGALSRRLGRGGGTSLPGVVLLRLHPGAIAESVRGLNRGVLTVSATNGKTTTARLIRSIVDDAGWITVANTAGSNLASGIATAMLDAPDDAELALLEVDEAALPAIAVATAPRVMVLMNLFRDQLDRYGELETVLAKWRTMVAALTPATTLVVNADDPSLAPLVPPHGRVLRFGLEDPAIDRVELSHAADSTHCPICATALAYDLVTIGHLGHWRCPGCGLARPEPEIAVRRVSLAGLAGSRLEVDTPAGSVAVDLTLPGLPNVYNAAAALAAAVALELPIGPAASAVGRTNPAFGRGERLAVDGRDIILLLAKNPTGVNENVRTILLDPEPLHVLVLLNDRTADGRDVSWIWDVDYEPLLPRLASLTLGGDRAYDLALRFRYGGFDQTSIEVVPDAAAAFDATIARAPAGSRVYVLPTYTALLDLRDELTRRGLVTAFWEDR